MSKQSILLASILKDYEKVEDNEPVLTGHIFYMLQVQHIPLRKIVEWATEKNVANDFPVVTFFHVASIAKQLKNYKYFFRLKYGEFITLCKKPVHKPFHHKSSFSSTSTTTTSNPIEASKMQTSSSGNPLKVKRVQKAETLSSASPVNKKINDMTQEKVFHYQKDVKARDKTSFSSERRKSRRIAEMQIRNKKKEKDDGKVQAAAKPEKEMKIKNPCMPESSKTPIFPKAFPIYSKNNVCGYLYMNNNQTPPTKVTLANVGASMAQTLPNTCPLNSAVHKPVVTPSKQNVEFLNNVDTLLLNNVPINPRTPAAVPSMTTIIHPKMINTSPLSEVQKPMDNNLKTLTPDIPIQPKTLNTLYLIPVEGQSNGSKQCPRNFILLSNLKTKDQNGANLGSTLNNPTESNSLLPLVNHGANNKTDNSVQSISAHSSEPQDSKVKCKLKTIDQICIKKEPTEMEDQYENEGRQSEFEAGENVHLSSDFIIETKKLNDEYERKQKICKTEPVEEEGCGLVISSTFSLSDFSQLYDFI